ncbi:MAG: metallohydrolase [Halioglobus sp.]|nr:metallohydrolase [Halioglobus sp.]
MAAKVTFFPVDNGDMTLIQLADADKTCLLIDCKIRSAADNPEDGTPDVAKELRNRIKTDINNRPYVDAMLLSHPDEDHCLGLKTHFWLGPIAEYADDAKPQLEKRIIIRQLWSSPMVFRRASNDHLLCPDAKAFNKEAKRRVAENLKQNFSVGDGDKILIIGEDENGKTDNLGPVLIKSGERFSGINGQAADHLVSHILAPISKQSDVEEEILSKNGSSVIISYDIKNSAYSSTVSRFLSGGDAGVDIWERISGEFESSDLEYDLLQAPHHCSWRSLSHDSWSDNGESAQISQSARSALGHARNGAIIVSSSKPIVDDKDDPPCIRAKREYRSILGNSGIFKCTGEEPNTSKPAPLQFEATASGFKLAVGISAAAVLTSSSPPRAG